MFFFICSTYRIEVQSMISWKFRQHIVDDFLYYKSLSIRFLYKSLSLLRLPLVLSLCFMVLILEVNSEIGVNVWSDLGYLIWLRRLFRSRAVTNQYFFLSIRPIFRHTCATCSGLPSLSLFPLSIFPTIRPSPPLFLLLRGSKAF